jgi:hypothetical protein
MPKFSVQMVKTITTHIEVEASDATEARRQIKEYGAIEAVSDYKVLSETIKISIGKAGLI